MSDEQVSGERAIAEIVQGMRTRDGAGVTLTRLIGTPSLRRLDPFLMLDDFGSDEPTDYLAGFPDHPHRGFETITYMVEGRFRHRDNKGHEGLLETGGAQWMTAGAGIIHAEMPEQKEGRVRGFQLWLNLPRADKLCPADYRDVPREQMTLVNLEEGVIMRLLAGAVGGAVGPIAPRFTEPFFAELAFARAARVSVPLSPRHNAFVYPFEHDVRVGEERQRLARGELGVLTLGDRVMLEGDAGAKLIVVAGKPLGEPIVQHGPFVMSTEAEIRQAIADYRAGRF